ncbi:MAG: hypothetical protein LBN95_08970 [Prevotellaceae bacterium]|nr:hypothetical protein [Prevotellaceae bacterium]
MRISCEWLRYGANYFALIYASGFVEPDNRNKQKTETVCVIFMKKSKPTNMGNVVRRKLLEQKRSISWLANTIIYDRGNLYRMLHKKDVNLHILRRISYALKYNFVRIISDEIDEDFVYNVENDVAKSTSK